METGIDGGGEETPRPCRSGCGFYGRPATGGLCSRCAKDAPHAPPDTAGGGGGPQSAEKASDSSPPAAAEPPGAASQSAEAGCRTEPTDAAASAAPAAESDPPAAAAAEEKKRKKKPGRCAAEGCRVRLGLMGWDCRCGEKFCSEHRYSDQHNCTFDYHRQAQTDLAKANPKVVADKIARI